MCGARRPQRVVEWVQSQHETCEAHTYARWALQIQLHNRILTPSAGRVAGTQAQGRAEQPRCGSASSHACDVMFLGCQQCRQTGMQEHTRPQVMTGWDLARAHSCSLTPAQCGKHTQRRARCRNTLPCTRARAQTDKRTHLRQRASMRRSVHGVQTRTQDN
jgi:hypothetical protein